MNEFDGKNGNGYQPVVEGEKTKREIPPRATQKNKDIEPNNRKTYAAYTAAVLIVAAAAIFGGAQFANNHISVDNKEGIRIYLMVPFPEKLLPLLPITRQA